MFKIATITLTCIIVSGCSNMGGDPKSELAALDRQTRESFREVSRLQAAAYAERLKNDREHKASLRAQGYTVCENKGSGIIACK